MKVINVDKYRLSINETASSVGFFDGVHRGHRHLIEQLKAKGASSNLPSSVVTFFAHPKKVLQSEYTIKLLNSFDERIKLLASTGIDYAYIIHFTPDFSKITAEDFVRNILSKQLKIRFLLIGYDHRFGKGGQHGFEDYSEYGKTCGMAVEKAEELSCNSDFSYSSTFIRRLLQQGELRKATEILSYPYALEGSVAIGNHLGRTIGFPTANIELLEKEKLIPCAGVYACRVEIEEKKYTGMLYIGRRPTVLSGGEERIEVHIFDFEENIYGKKIRVELIDFVRPEASFQNMEDLQQQLKKDKQEVHALFSNR